jgi:hypothetical protein
VSKSNTANLASALGSCDILLSTMDYCKFISFDGKELSKYSFIADSSGSSHMENSKNILKHFVPEEGTVKVGDNQKIVSKGYGSYIGIHNNQNGEKVKSC